MATTTKPVATFKLGRIQAAVWANEGGKGRFYSVTIERRYHDDGWKSSRTFSRNDLPLVAKVADQAHSWIYDQRPDSEDSVATDGDAPSGDVAGAARYYHVCSDCNAKFFSSDMVERCNRCGSVSRSTELIIPPWKDQSTAADSEEQMRALYLEQQARLACPGCGEEPFIG